MKMLQITAGIAMTMSVAHAMETLSVTGATGHVAYSPSKSSSLKPVVSNTGISAGSEIKTGADGVAVMALEGNTRLKLLPKSDLEINSLGLTNPPQTVAAFAPTGSAIKSVLTHTDTEITPSTLDHREAVVTLKSGSAMATVERTDCLIKFPLGTISSTDAWFTIITESTGSMRVTVAQGAVTLTPVAGKDVVISGGMFARINRDNDGAVKITGPLAAATEPSAKTDILAFQAIGGRLEPIAEYEGSGGKEVLDGKQVLNGKELLPVAELLPSAVNQPGQVGIGFSTPFDLLSSSNPGNLLSPPNPSNSNTKPRVSPVNP